VRDLRNQSGTFANKLGETDNIGFPSFGSDKIDDHVLFSRFYQNSCEF